MQITRRLLRWLAAASLIAGLPAWGQDDPPGRVGRIGEIQGKVSLFDGEARQWVPALLNRPLTGGDRIVTEPGSRAVLQVGSTTLRLAGGSELEVLRLDDERIAVQLNGGSLALRVRLREVADEIDVVTAETRLQPLRSGHFRIDRSDETTFAASWRGELRVQDDGERFTIEAGRRAELWREGPSRSSLRRRWTSVPDDDFADWVAREDRRDESLASSPYVSPEMTGAEDLGRYGRWEQHPEYGALWWPLAVQVGWAPYRYGHWAYIRPWGWTWVDDAPWGFAPFHYGRWVSLGGRWAWSPGVYVPRPVYAPALVAWVGGPQFSVSVSVGGPLLPAVGWVPLAPREVFVPYYRGSPRYVDRVNPHPPGRPRPPVQVPTGPVMYGNQGVPGAVTVVPRDVLVQRQPVGRAVIELRDPVRRALPVAPAAPVSPVPRAATAPTPVPGGALPAPVPQPGTPAWPRPTRPAPPEPQMQSRPMPPRAGEPTVPQPPREVSREPQRETSRNGARVPAPPPVVDLRDPRASPGAPLPRPAAPPAPPTPPTPPAPAGAAPAQPAPPAAPPRPAERDSAEGRMRAPEQRERGGGREREMLR
jgi:hypothetical protein